MCVEVELTPVPTHSPKGLSDWEGEGEGGGKRAEVDMDRGRWSIASAPQKSSLDFTFCFIAGSGLNF